MLVLACAGALPAYGQQAAEEERADEFEEQIDSRREVQRTADDALGLEELGGGPPVTYQQVLADPDNIDLNIRYALTQIRDGNVRGAGATLERILLIRPDLASVRVLFAIVLFRRKRMPFKWLVGLFAAFIVLCGTTHILGIVTQWNPIWVRKSAT